MEEPLKDLSRLPDQEIDKALFARYQEDASTFTAIYERFSPELLVFIEAHLEGVLRSDAEDILHDTFMAFYKMRDRLEPNTKLRGLLYRIAERRLNDRLRAALAQKRCVSKTEHTGNAGNAHFDSRLGSRDTDRDREGDNCPSAKRDYGTGGVGTYHISDPKSDPAVRDAKLDFDEAVAKLRATEQQAVRMELDGHTHASAAKALNLSESTFWSRLRSGRKHLKELLTGSLILTISLGALANEFDPDNPEPICTCEAETDDDTIREEAHGHADLDKQYRKGLMRLLVRPIAGQRDRLTTEAVKETGHRLAFHEEHPRIYEIRGKRPEAYSVFRAGSTQVARSRCQTPSVRSREAA
jgi:RNA polymerase sigma factor (sigma-70 family)